MMINPENVRDAQRGEDVALVDALDAHFARARAMAELIEAAAQSGGDAWDQAKGATRTVAGMMSEELAHARRLVRVWHESKRSESLKVKAA